MIRPPDAQPLLAVLPPRFTQPTAARFVAVTAAAILTTGRRTVGRLARGHDASYPRVLSAARWFGLELGCALTRHLLTHLLPAGPVHPAGDDTADDRPGRQVYGMGRHRDPVSSSRAFTAWRYGHRWGVLAVLAQLPFAQRRWALPVLVDLYHTPEVSRAEGARHRAPAQPLCRLLRLVLLRFPDRPFVSAGDSSFRFALFLRPRDSFSVRRRTLTVTLRNRVERAPTRGGRRTGRRGLPVRRGEL